MIRIVPPLMEISSMSISLEGKKVLIKLGTKLLERIDKVAIYEQRTRSDVMREALRDYTYRKELAFVNGFDNDGVAQIVT